MAVQVGKQFHSLSELEEAVKSFEKEQLANFIKNDSKRLKENLKDGITSDDVEQFVYSKIYYVCRCAGLQKLNEKKRK